MPSNASARASTTSPHVTGVSATSGGLIKATLGAAAVAAAILTFVWLPAEYGIDPTGVGQMLGLTEMGQIKQQLHAEGEADFAAATKDISSDSEVSRKLDAIQAQLAAIAVAVGTTSPTTDTEQTATQQAALSTPEPKTSSSAQPTAVWRDEVEYSLAPGEGIEVKLVMIKGAIAQYEWNANGSVLNHDTHGDGNGQNISYKQGRSVPGQSGQLIAAFTGNHGWFWRNRTDEAVLVTLRARGDYKELMLP